MALARISAVPVTEVGAAAAGATASSSSSATRFMATPRPSSIVSSTSQNSAVAKAERTEAAVSSATGAVLLADNTSVVRPPVPSTVKAVSCR